jgi:hypothetical protein
MDYVNNYNLLNCTFVIKQGNAFPLYFKIQAVILKRKRSISRSLYIFITDILNFDNNLIAPYADGITILSEHNDKTAASSNLQSHLKKIKRLVSN